MESKIKKYEEEIARIQEVIRKNEEKIKELKLKIKEEQQRIDQHDSAMIVDAVRSLYGMVNENNLEEFKKLLRDHAKITPTAPAVLGENE